MTGSYPELLLQYVPKLIENEADYNRIQNLVDQLLDLPAMNTDQRMFLSLLGLLIERYEHALLPDFELRGAALVKALIRENRLRQKDLVPIFKTESIVSAVLSGRRRLTVDHIDQLAEFFQLPHSYFFEPRKIEAISGLNHANTPLVA